MPFDAAWMARSGVESMHVGEVVDVVLRDLLVGEREMVVRVDETRQHGQLRQIDDLGAGRDRHVGADGRDPLALDQDDLVGRGGAGFRIDQPAGADGDGAGRLRRRLRLRAIGAILQ